MKGELDMSSLVYNSKVQKVVMYMLTALLLIASVLSVVTAWGSDFSSLAGEGEKAITEVKDGIVKIAMAAGPLAMIICLLIIMFSHDSRKVSMVVGILITIFIAWLAIMIINSGYVKDFISHISDTYFKGGGSGTTSPTG